MLTSKEYLKEGRDFSILFYGGSILSHFTVSDFEVEKTIENEVDDFISLLRINRNIAVIMDRDKEEGAKWNTKIRINNEVKMFSQSLTWITKGKEIENYLSKESIERAFPNSIQSTYSQNSLKPFGNFFRNSLENRKPSSHKKFYEESKVDFAQKVLLKFTAEDLTDNKELFDKVSELYNLILSWNRTPPPAVAAL